MPLAAYALVIGPWFLFWAFVSGILLGYHRIVSARRARMETPVDFAETRPLKYVGLAVLFGGLVLPFYFYSVKRNFRGALLGVGWLAAAVAGTALTRGAVIRFVAPVPHVRITEPEDGAVVSTELLNFEASMGSATSDELAAPKSFVWQVDQRAVPGKWDESMLLRALPPGRHEVSVTVANWYGNRSTAVIHVLARENVRGR